MVAQYGHLIAAPLLASTSWNVKQDVRKEHENDEPAIELDWGWKKEVVLEFEFGVVAR